MRIKTIVPAAAAAALLVSAAACDHGLTNVNKNPNAPEDVPPANLLINAERSTVASAYGIEGIWYNLYLGETWSQQAAEVQYNDEDKYTPRPDQLSGVWSSAYSGPLKDLDQVKRYAAASGDATLGAVADALMQLNFQVLTDTYGDIPYSQALKADSGITAPVFDTQKDVYYGMLAHLTADAATLASGSTGAWSAGDAIYGGSPAAWRKFVNSLRMRMAMRLADADPAKAQSEFVAAYNAGGFSSNGDNAVFNFGTSQPDQAPYYDYWYNQDRFDFVVSATMVNTLKAHNDPRLQVYAAPASNGGGYRGLVNGTLPGDSSLTANDYSTLGDALLAPNAPSYIMTYAEVSFLEAEAAARGWIGGSPAALYQQGITASMEQYGIADSDITAYLADPANAYTGLPSLWLQKWIALFGNGPEAWAEERRTNYPKLDPAIPEAPSIPQRLTYPSEEQLLNATNWSTAVGRSGGKSLWDPMWWDKTPPAQSTP